MRIKTLFTLSSLTLSSLTLSSLTLFVACTDDGEGGPVPEDPTSLTVIVEHVAPVHPYFISGSFDTPTGASQPGPLLPGQSYSFEFHASPGMALSFATMFVPSNDLFFAPDGEGIALFDEAGQPLAGDVTDQIEIWDAGTELDEDLGLGDDQAPNQASPGSGDPDPNPGVRPASESYADLPAVADLIKVTLAASEGNAFTLTIENVGDDQSLVQTDNGTRDVPLAPGVFVVHSQANPLFTVGEPAPNSGLAALVEDGDPAPLAAALAPQSGVVSPLAPGIWVVHGEGEELFTVGAPDLGRGLEVLAEDGDGSVLLGSYPEDASVGLFGGTYDDAPGPLQPGMSFSFEIEVRPGDRLSFASMFAQSNDLFLAPDPAGVELFDADGNPRLGDISAGVRLWDLGTEINEYPGAGPNQAPRQSGPNTGVDEGGVVGPVDDGYSYPAPTDVLRVQLLLSP